MYEKGGDFGLPFFMPCGIEKRPLVSVKWWQEKGREAYGGLAEDQNRIHHHGHQLP